MDFKGKYSIPAAPDRVLAALREPSTLLACIPGGESVDEVNPNEYKAVATLKIGPVKARFQGKVIIEDIIPPPGIAHAMRLSGEGQGGAAGFARGQSEVHLAAEDGHTILEYSAKAVVGGKLAQIGQRLIDGAAKSVADEFFARFSALMQTKAATPAPPPAAPPARAPAAQPPASEGLAPQVWVAGLIGIIVILLIFFSIVL
ncbi:MAG TPA: carbon monoxide dehydrogenase subunit G [Micropepsaceae bacterium]|nr:carbon monoxide dehydrogenase subunit G [Micropepsaceae bacterium]